MTRRRPHLICILVSLLCIVPATARLIVYEGFDYPADQPLAGNNSGMGWEQPWTGGSTVLAPGLQYRDLYVTGNTGAITIANDPTFRAMPAGFDASNRTIWISFLAHQKIPASYAGISTFLGDSESLFMGSIWDTSPPRYWGVRIYNVMNDTNVELGPAFACPIQTTEQVFFVARIINGPNSARLTCWVNPPLGIQPDPATAWFDRTVGRIPFDRIRFNSWADGPIRYDYDEIRIGDTYADVAPIGRKEASGPRPADGQEDVDRQVVLTWRTGIGAVAHDVYFGANLADVNSAGRTDLKGVLLSQAQDANAFDPPGLLDLGGRYFWRVDEIAEDQSILKGPVWQFTAEPVAYTIGPGLATAAAFSSDPRYGPENTVNGSGLDPAGGHSTVARDMWQSGPSNGQPAWLLYTFDRVYKLHQVRIWNYNGDLEYVVGLGIRDVTVEYSIDGAHWHELGRYVIAQGTSSPGYKANTQIELGGILARQVRLVIHSGWGTTGRYGLSEIRFLYIPTRARDPDPAGGATGLPTDLQLYWRPGREAASHQVLFGTDMQAVADGTVAPIATVDNRLPMAGLDLDTTYYWRVDEVNGSEPIQVWEGPVWPFTTKAYYLVEGFEQYTEDKETGKAIWQNWADGYEDPDNGSQVGHLNVPFVETGIVHSGGQSMPFYYDNLSGAMLSEGIRTFDTARDWTKGGARFLLLYFHGRPENIPGRLYLKINNVTVPYGGPQSDLTRSSWIQWTIDLAAVATDLTKVDSLAIGVDNGGSGLLYVDDIRLYRLAP